MSEQEERSSAFLETSVKNFKIFIDTCSLLSEQADLFWFHILPVLERKKKYIIVPYRVYEEVRKFADDTDLCARKNNPALNQRAKVAVRKIEELHGKGLVHIQGEKQDNFADNVFQTVFTKFRMKYNLMLITQDHNLATDIIAIGQSRSVSTNNRIMVERINQYGYLSMFRSDSSESPGQQPSAACSPKSPVLPPVGECFAFTTVVRQVSGRLAVTDIPGEGSELIALRGNEWERIRLAKQGPSGGEGIIFTTSLPGIVAKIYKQNKVDRARYEKLSLMVSKTIEFDGICFPLALLVNRKKEFVGYLMRQAMGKELQRCVFIPQLLKKNFPGWTKVDTVTLCITILKKLKYLHERNIILGDINPNNILVVSPTEVYFVDADSYQVEGFPCPVGTINYTAPEIQRRDFSTFLRTAGHERFAVAVLLFMIMLPGKPPYSLQGGENQIDNIINGDFAYPSGSRSTGKAPEGMWRFCWSHLPRYLKDDFYETFRKGGEHSAEKTRYSTGDWLQKFEHYLNLLTSGKLATQDAMSMDIFPTRLKKNPNATYIICKLCGMEVDEDWTEQGICQACLKKGETYTCSKCGGEMFYSNYQKYIKKTPRYETCRDCNDKRNAVYMILECPICGKKFQITNGEREWYDEKGYQIPKKCKDCRGQKTYAPTSRSASRPASSPARTSSTSGTSRTSHVRTSTPPSSPSRKKSGSCFITTAVCQYYGKSDDCYELTSLRQFRDGWLAAQPGGEEVIQEYYRIAPSIVSAIDAARQWDSVYPRLWEQYILPCVRLIERNDYRQCRELYEQMVLYVKNEYGEGSGA